MVHSDQFVFDEKVYFDQTFSHITLEDGRLELIEFQNCRFKQCKFTAVIFSKIRFTECDFEHCDLSLSKFPGCKFSEVAFNDSKLIGINWTELNWPLVKLTSPIYFYNSNISHSSFYGLELTNLILENCKAHDIDFREANLSHASFVGTDLHNSLFMHTSLNHADFTEAINYIIDIQQNRLSRASFSLPDVIGLLTSLDIKIKGGPDSDS